MKNLILITAIMSISSIAVASSWDKITPSADFRYRLENTSSIEDVKISKSTSRQQMRATFGLKYDADENTSLNLRLATGGNAVDTNNTLGRSDGDSGDSGEAYFDRIFVSSKMNNMTLNLGRMENMFFKAGNNQLIFDEDYNPEGVHVSYTIMGIYLNVASFWIDESEDDKNLTASQLGYTRSSGKLSYNLGVSNYHFEKDDSNNLETFIEIKYLAKLPVTFYASMANNTAEAVDDGTKANIYGITVGEATEKGDWSVGVSQRMVEVNSVNDAFNYNDHEENDHTGMIYKFSYKTSKISRLDVTYFATTLNADKEEAGDTYTGTKSEEFTKLQVDFNVKF